jgi:hypothetical protein
MVLVKLLDIGWDDGRAIDITGPVNECQDESGDWKPACTWHELPHPIPKGMTLPHPIPKGMTLPHPIPKGMTRDFLRRIDEFQTCLSPQEQMNYHVLKYIKGRRLPKSMSFTPGTDELPCFEVY